MGAGVAKLVGAGALPALGASRETLAAGLVAIGEPATADAVTSTIGGIDADSRAADVPDYTRSFAITAVTWIGTRVYAVHSAEHERRFAADRAAVWDAGVRLLASVRQNSSIGQAGVEDWNFGVGWQ
jgi:hypothetical protein